ncbi:hypothetical protein Ade02nite_94690 [Paractinoplanes deccanensis]|uniref:DUF4352 domain-containing protein n=1 Tax=Paractinoplanes deccanensis TaxID=113561 RepID=A0ABQ3YLF9_9ACTN|nr:hypothetical protein [Actinoplanes deccanensis]GID80828.1 hypothetical protein Ade02nite_94690 [Actinoplanes deccanensis]
MTIPKRPGWTILAAVAGALLFFAARTGRRKRPAAPRAEPSPLPQPRPLPSPRTGAADRALVRMAVAAGVVVILAIAVTVVTRPPAPASAPGTVVLTGDGGARAEVSLGRVSDLPSDFPGARDVMITVHLRNTGRPWIGTRLDVDARAYDAGGVSYGANQMLSLTGGPYGSTDPGTNEAWRLYRDQEIDRTVAFSVPEAAGLTRLHVSLLLGTTTRTAELAL